MKKALNIALTAILLAVVFLGCKQATGKDKDKEKEAEKQSYTITFDLDGGTVAPAIKDNKLTGKEGEEVKKPNNPTKEGYTFLAWEPPLPEKFPAKNISVKATWKAEKPSYTITLDLDGGTVDPPIKNNKLTGKEGEEVKKPSNPTKKGYTFLAWEPPLPEKFPAKNISVKATWKAEKPSYTITLDLDGGTVDPPIKDNKLSGKEGEEVKKPNNPTKKGYTFLAWEPPLPEKFPANNISVKATWEEYKPKISIKGDERIDPNFHFEETVNYATTWSEIKDAIKKKVGELTLLSKYQKDYEKYRLCLNDKNATIIASIDPDGTIKEEADFDDHSFKEDSVIYVVTNYNKFTIKNSKFTIERTLTGYTGNRPSGTIYIPDGITSIGAGAFQTCVDLTSITFPASLTSIQRKAFDSCRGLTSITLPASLTSISAYAFYACSNLTSIELPDKLTLIYEGAFARCINLQSITLPAKLNSISDSTFSYCVNLKSITLPTQLRWIGKEAFKDCIHLASIILPDTLTSIGVAAFQNCVDLTSITFPTKLTGIGEQAFKDCSSLTSATFKDPTKWHVQMGSYTPTYLASELLAYSKVAARYLTAKYCDFGYWEKEK